MTQVARHTTHNAITEALSASHPPEYIDLHKPDMIFRLQYIPKRDEIPLECDNPQVVEFYSR